VWCTKHRAQAKFDTTETERSSYVFQSELNINGRVWQARGLTKEHARSKYAVSYPPPITSAHPFPPSSASKVALEALSPKYFELCRAADEKRVCPKSPSRSYNRLKLFTPDSHHNRSSISEKHEKKPSQSMRNCRRSKVLRTSPLEYVLIFFLPCSTSPDLLPPQFPDEDPTFFQWAIRIHNYVGKRWKDKPVHTVTQVEGVGYKCVTEIGGEHRFEGEGKTEKAAKAKCVAFSYALSSLSLTTDHQLQRFASCAACTST
jgi:hypothetical protein